MRLVAPDEHAPFARNRVTERRPLAEAACLPLFPLLATPWKVRKDNAMTAPGMPVPPPTGTCGHSPAPGRKHLTVRPAMDDLAAPGGIIWKEHVLTARNLDYGGTEKRFVFEAWRDKPGTVHGFGTSLEDALADLLRREHDATLETVEYRLAEPEGT
jgi:hypothetical protein